MHPSLYPHHTYVYVVDRLKVNVVRAYVGPFMTSLEMAGVSLTLLHMIPELQWEELLGKLTHVLLLTNDTCDHGNL